MHVCVGIEDVPINVRRQPLQQLLPERVKLRSHRRGQTTATLTPPLLETEQYNAQHLLYMDHVLDELYTYAIDAESHIPHVREGSERAS